MIKLMKDFIKYSIIILAALSIILIGYNIFDNNRIAVVEQTIEIDNLPESFEGFTILQITDLHEKRFGKNQERLVNKINNIDYDIIAMTGDMQSIGSMDNEPMLDLIDNLKDSSNIYYTGGNHGPTYNKELEKRNVKSVYTPQKIERGEDVMWLYDFFNEKGFESQPEEFRDEDIKIGIGHYPWDENFYTSFAPDNIGHYDLVLAGHYHGGQVRIPFWGAIFVPDINGNGWFPNQDEVSGLQEYGEYKQYISTGLGASPNSMKLNFRLFNTPEINVIKLVKSN